MLFLRLLYLCPSPRMNEWMDRYNTGALYGRRWDLRQYLRVPKVCAQHLSDVLCVRQIQGGVHLIQDVDGSRFEQQHGQDERQGHKWSATRNTVQLHKKKRQAWPYVTICRVPADLWPPLSSLRFSFQVVPKATLNSRPSKTPQLWRGASLAVAPGSRVEKIEPKSLFTCRGRAM